MRKLSEIEADDKVELPNVVLRAQAWVDRRELVSALREAMELLDGFDPDCIVSWMHRRDALRARVQP